MANHRDNIFRLFQGDGHAAALQQQQRLQLGGRRQYLADPSQISNLPGGQHHIPRPPPPNEEDPPPPPPGGRGPPRLLLTGEIENERNANNNFAPARVNNLPPVPAALQAVAGPAGGVPRFQAAQPGGAPGVGGAVPPRLQQLAPVRGPPPGTPPDRDRDFAVITPPRGGGGGGGGAGGRGGGPPPPPPLRLGPISEIREIREMEERLIAAESAAAQQSEVLSRLRQLERRVALAEAARKEAEGGGRGEVEAIESRVAHVQHAVARADGVMAELRGRLEAAERDAAESRAQVMRVEAAAQVAMSGARDTFERIQQRIGIEQGSDARRLDQLSAEMARLTREVADTRGEEASKRQALEAVIARLEGQVSIDNSLIGALREADADTVQAAAAQFGDVRMKLQNTEDVVRSLVEQLLMERQARAEAEARTEATVQRLEELGNQREHAVMRRFEHELQQRVAEISRRVIDESEGAAERDQAIVREKDEQLSAFQKGNQRERQKNIEHMLVVEKAIREEHAQRVGAVAVITKSIDKVNKEVTGLLRDEKAAREAREGKLRGQISQSVLKLHAANKETQRKLEAERDGIHKVLKTEIRARMNSLEKLAAAMSAADAEHDRRLAAGRVEAAQALRSAEVKLSRRLTATEGRVEVEVAALRKLYARQTQLERDLDAFKRDAREAFERVQDDLISAAVAQALNTECDAVNGDILQVTVKDLNDRIDRQDARDREKASMLEAAVSVLGEGQSGLQVRADKTEQDVADIFDALVADERARAELEKAIARVAAAGEREAATRAEKDRDIRAALAKESAVRAAFDAAELSRVVDLETRADVADDRLSRVDAALEELQEDVDASAAASALETETLKLVIDEAARERGDNAEAAERIAERQTFVEEGLGELKGDLAEGMENVRGELDAAAEDIRDAVAKESDARAEALGALEQRVVEASVKTRAEMDEAHANLRRAVNAEVAARQKAAAQLHDRVDDETEARLADGAAFQEMLLEETRERDEAVVRLWAALEENHVAAHLEAECARIDAEEFSVAQVEEWRAAIGREGATRDAALVKLKAHVSAVVADEAKARARGDVNVRHAYEDDIANLEDTAAEAVRELREGLRTEVTERRSQAETLLRDLGDALDAARSRLERDVRALEETAASNIAAQKLEEEMMRAELDDGMMRVDEAVEALRADADANAARAEATFAAAASRVGGLVAAGVAPVEAKLERLAEAVEGGMNNLEASIEKEVEARHEYVKAAQEAFDQMQDGISVGMLAMNAKVEEMVMAQVSATSEEFNELRNAVAESLESTNVAIEEAFDEVHKDMSRLEANVDAAAASAVTAEEATRVELEMMVEEKVRLESRVREAAVAELRDQIRGEMDGDATAAAAAVDSLNAALDDLRQEVEQEREMQGEEMKAVNVKLDDLERDTAEAITEVEEKLRSDLAAEASARVVVENQLRVEIAKEGATRVAASVTAAEAAAETAQELRGKMRDLQLAVREEFDEYTAQVMLDMEAQRTDLEEKMIAAERASNDAADEIRAAVTESEAAAAAASDALREEIMASLDAEAERTDKAIDEEAALREELAARLNEARANIADSMEVERENTLEALTRLEENVTAEAKARAEAVEAEARERQDLAAELAADIDGVASDAKADVETLRAELHEEIADAVADAAAAAADQLAAAMDDITAAAAEELAAEASAVREEIVQSHRRIREEYTEALQGEAEMRERGDVAAAEGRAGLTGSIEEDRAVLSRAIAKLEGDLAAETEARREADDAAAADAATREDTLRTEVLTAVDELDARVAANLEDESNARRDALAAAAAALDTVAASSAEAVAELAAEFVDKINATKEEVLQLIAGEAEERTRAVKEAVDAEAAERREADQAADKNLVDSLAHEMEQRATAVEAARVDLGADIVAESEALRAALTAHADEAAETAAAAAAAAGASVAAEVTARAAAIDELRGVVEDGLKLAAEEGRDQLKAAIEREAEALREEIAATRRAGDDAVAGEAAARDEALDDLRGEMAEETAARTTADQEEAEARLEAIEVVKAGVEAAAEAEKAARVAQGETFAKELVTVNAQLGEFKSIVDAEVSRLGADLGEASGARENIAKEIEALQERVAADVAAEAKAREEALAAFATEAAMKTELASLGEQLEGKLRDAAAANAGRDDEILQLITKEVADRDVAVKIAVDAETTARAQAMDEVATALKSVMETQSNALTTAMEEADAATTKKIADADASAAAAREELKAKVAEALTLGSETQEALRVNLAAEANERKEAVARLTAAVDAETRERREAVSAAKVEAEEGVKTAMAELEGELKPRIEAVEAAVAGVKEKVANAATSAAEAKGDVHAVRGELVEIQAAMADDASNAIDKKFEEKQFVTMEEVGEALAGLDKQISVEVSEREKAVGAVRTEVDEAFEKKLKTLEAKINELVEANPTRAPAPAAVAAAAAAAAPTPAEDAGVKAAAGIAERAAISAATASAAAEDAKANVAALTEKFEKLRGDHEALIATEKENAKQDAMMAERFNNLVKDVERIEKEGRENAEKIVAEKLAKSQDELKGEISKGQAATGAALAQILGKLSA